MIETQILHERLLASLAEAQIAVDDLTGTRDHFEARIVSPAFGGKTLLERHRMVYAALGDAMQGPIHALALHTYTPEEWATQKGDGK